MKARISPTSKLPESGEISVFGANRRALRPPMPAGIPLPGPSGNIGKLFDLDNNRKISFIGFCRMNPTNHHESYDELFERLRHLEDRLGRVEALLRTAAPLTVESSDEPSHAEVSSGGKDRSEDLEFEIGQYWFTRVGIIALTAGFVFLLTLPYPTLAAAVPAAFGYILAAALAWTSRALRSSFGYLTESLIGASLTLFFAATIRLSFFSVQPAVADPVLRVVLLGAVVAIHLIVSIRRSSAVLTVLGLFFGYLTSLLVPSDAITLAMMTALSATVFILQRGGRWTLLVPAAMVLGGMTATLWWLGNPLLTGQIHPMTTNPGVVFGLILNILVLGGAGIRGAGSGTETISTGIGALVSGGMLYGLLAAMTIVSYGTVFTESHLLASAVYLVLAAAGWKRLRSRYVTFLYAMVGYMALSIAILKRFDPGDALVWLAWQSVLVTATAVWFRSKYIVVANFVIYVAVLVSFVAMGGAMTWLNLSFGVVALLNARILSAQQHRLELRTEMMRNVYLASAFCFFPYALYHIVPSRYVALSWLGIGLVYYLLNMVLQKQKYRWMALLTLLLTATYVLVVGIISLEATYRIVSLIALGIVFLVASGIYATIRRRNGRKQGRGADDNYE
jgi:hypothetical protein